MKKKIIVLGLMVALVIVQMGCSSNAVKSKQTTTETTIAETTTQDTSEPNPIGLYLKHRELGTYELITEYKGDWVIGKDIKAFEAFASNEALISGDTYGNLWKARWNDHPDVAISKIGYRIDIVLKDGGTITRMMTRPSDTVGDFNDYVEVWIYDDIYNLGASWYSHLTEADFSDSSLMTSIKLTAAEKIDDVSEIKLTAFIYDSANDFNQETGEYTGQNYYQISILRAN